MKNVLLSPLCLLVGLAGGAAWAAPRAGEDQVRRDMEFARSVAKRFAYVDIAERVMKDLEARDLQGEDAEALALLRCDVYAVGARGGRTVEERVERYEKAIAAFKTFIEEHPYSDLLATAQRNYVDLVNAYGRVLEFQLEDALGPEAEAIRSKIVEVVEDGLELTGELIDATSNARTQVEKNERYRLMLNRGQMYLTVANVSADGTYEYDQALATLEQLVGEASEASAWGLTAFILMAKVYVAQGQYLDAADFAVFVLGAVLPPEEERETQNWSELDFTAKSQRWLLGEQAAPVVIDSYNELGESAEACKWALHVYNYRRAEGFEVSPLGHLAMLSAARALFDSGGYVGGGLNSGELSWFATEEEMRDAGYTGARNARSALDMALTIAEEVNSENKGNTLQIQAQKLISAIIDRPGVVVQPEILMQAAQGDYYADDFEKAIASYKSILRGLSTQDEATQQTFAPQALYFIGRSLEKLDRPLEAAMAYREAGTTWGGDLNYQEQIADGFYRSAARARNDAGGDPQLQALVLEAENLQREAGGGSVGAITYRQGERLYVDEKYAEARSKFREVSEDDEIYEKALVRAALCLYRTEDYAGARRELRAYLEQRVADPRTKPVDASAIKVRNEARALATYYLGSMAYDAGEYAKAVEYLSDYDKSFPSQDSLGPQALYTVVRAHVNEQQISEAKAVVATMKQTFSKSIATGAAAGQIYSALRTEFDAATEAGDAERARAVEREMAEYMRLANELARTPSYTNLRQESALWMSLGDWDEAERVLRELVAAFRDDAEVDLTTHVLPDLGQVLLEQERVPEAFAVLDPLLDRTPDSKANPKSLLVLWSRAVTGWIKGDEGNWVEVPGVGGAENLALATGFLRALTDAEKVQSGAYEGPWYELKFQTAYAYYQWGKLDSAQMQNADALIENLKQRTGSTRLDDVTEKTGDDVLRTRFLWLAEKVR